MKYFITGRVVPERTDVHITLIKKDIVDFGTITFVCESSQINMTFDTHTDNISAFIICKQYASIIVSSLGFVNGSNYSIELISIIDENLKSLIFGVKVPGLEEKIVNPSFNNVMNLCFRDVFFRFAILDFTKSLTTELELPFLCYRAIETIKSRFFNDLLQQQSKIIENDAWELMHRSINSNKDEIIFIKKFADPIRHGNYYSFTSTNSQQRFEILARTKSIILKYKLFLENELL